ncbi:MAG: MxaD protein [Methylotenera sp.]|uniref:SRPBCC family protein n=1 Tax=Methylotenera sp. TaxID=2051956 RepID=UPI000D4F5B97|nr:SRPBCC family protein [Methylotenera sp.]PPC83820.1 MAG: MxaD protein [Methylotenera sp.]
MKKIYALILMAITAPALAHGPTPQKTDQSVLISASPEVVWKRLSEPCAIKDWHPDVVGCDSTTALKRTLVLKNGSKINEEIDEMLPSEMSISYRLGEIDIKALPVSSLTGRLKVTADGANTKVVWVARYYRADTTNEPPKGLDDESALNAVNAYVKAALAGLQKPMPKK